MFISRNNHRLLAGALIGVMLFGVSLLSMVERSEAAFNDEINYQGKLTDSSNIAVANGTYNMRFWLLTSPTIATTSAVWTESWTGANRVQVTNGLFSLMLGSTTSLANVDFNQTLYLGVEIGGTGGSPAWDGEMSPRKRLGAVPAAFEAEQLGGLATSSFLRADDPTTLYDSTAQTLFTIIQAGVGDILNIYDDATEVFTIIDGGKVGIGTSTPNVALSVDGDFRLTGGIYDNNNTRGAVGEILQTTGSGIDWVSTTTLGIISENLADNTLDNLSQTALSDPGADQIVFWDDSDTQFEFISTLTNLSISGNTLSVSDSFLLNTGDTATGDYTFDTDTLIVNATSDRVGIGTTTPYAKLSVTNTGTGPSFLVEDAASPDSTPFIISAAGLVGIGTASPQDLLHILGANAGSYIALRVENTGLNGAADVDLINDARTWKVGVNSSDDFRVRDHTGAVNPFTIEDAAPTNSLYVDSTGYVGLGATTPNTTFHVVGNSTFGAGFTPTVNNDDNIINIIAGITGNGAANGISFFEADTSTNGMHLGYDGLGVGEENALRIYDNNDAAVITFQLGGDVGIGTTSPYAKLSITNTGSNPSFIVEDSASVDSTPFIIDASGNVGIGTTTPGTLLSINGVANFRSATTTFYSTGGINLSAGCFAVNGTCVGASAGGITAIGPSGQTSDGPTVTIATSSDTNIGMTVTGSGDTLTFTSNWIGTLADARVADAITVTGGTIGSNTISSGAAWATAGTLTIGDGGDRIDIASSGWDVTNSVITSATWQGNAIGYLYGGTGNTSLPTDGQLLIGDGAGYTLATLTDGAGITITEGVGSISIASTLGTSVDLASAEVTGTLGIGNGGTNATGFGANRVIYMNSGNTAFTSSSTFAFDTAGDMGIGTSSPYAKLSVTNVGANPSFIVEDATGDTTPFVIGASGLVGIGTLTPGTALDIVGTAAAQLRLADTASNSTNKFSYISSRHFLTAEQDFSLLVGSSQAAINTVAIGGSSGSLNAATEIQFWTAATNATLTGTQQLTIDSAGDVGVGTTSPYAKFSVTNTGAGASFVVEDSSADSSPFLIDTSGNVGIADLTPDDLLNISSAAAQAAIAITSLGTDTDSLIKFELADGTATFALGVDDSDGDKFKISTTGLGTNDRFVIDSSGNVGIGTSTPGTLLSINSVANFQAATSTFYSTGGINLVDGCFAIDGVCVGGSAGGITAIGPTGQTSDGPTVTFATSSDTNIGLTVTGSGDTLTFTSNWIGTLADARVADTITVTGGTLGSNTIASGASWATAGTLTIGDGGDRIDVSSDSWDVVNGAMSGVTSLGVGAITTTGTLTFSGVTTDITTGVNEHLVFTPNGTGRVGIGTTTPGGETLGVMSNTTTGRGIYIAGNGVTTGSLFTLEHDASVMTTGTVFNIGESFYDNSSFAIQAYGVTNIRNNNSDYGGSLNIATNFDQRYGIVVRGHSPTQSYDLQQWQTSAGSVLTVVTSAGRIGIGDTTPDDLLNIHATSSAAALAITSLGTDTDALIKFELADGTATFSMGVDDSDSDKFKISTTGLGTSDRLVIDSSGRVGIGTSTPAAKLTIAGGAYTAEQKSTYSSAGTNNFVVPTGVYQVKVKAWGAGGGGGEGAGTASGGAGGGGGYAEGTILVTPGETIVVNVGTGGVANTGTQGAGNGGGYSGALRSSTPLLIAGGGGGGGAGDGTGEVGGTGGAGGGLTGTDGQDGGPGNNDSGGGDGGTQTAGGAGGTLGTGTNGTAGIALQGGNGGQTGTGGAGGTGGGGDGQADLAGGGGGGGSGWYGGGGGENGVTGGGASEGGAGGGGGSSGWASTTVSVSTTAGSGVTAGNTGDSDYSGSAGAGGAGSVSAGGAVAGTAGRVVLAYEHSGTTTPIFRIADSLGATLFEVEDGGNTGIGIGDPDTRLEVFDTVSAPQLKISYDSSRFAQLQVTSAGDLVLRAQGGDIRADNENLWVCTGGSCPTDDTLSGTGNLVVENKLYVSNGFPSAMGQATSTFRGDILITGKLDVGTIDPVYNIGGTKYATYGHATIGIKEEVVTTLAIESFNEDTQSYEERIEFSELPEGSDLWLFYQITSFGELWKDLVVNLTPGFDGSVFYTKIPEQNALLITSTRAGEVSARFIANRFDYEKWPNLRPDQDDAHAHFELEMKE